MSSSLFLTCSLISYMESAKTKYSLFLVWHWNALAQIREIARVGKATRGARVGGNLSLLMQFLLQNGSVNLTFPSRHMISGLCFFSHPCPKMMG